MANVLERLLQLYNRQIELPATYHPYGSLEVGDSWVITPVGVNIIRLAPSYRRFGSSI